MARLKLGNELIGQHLLLLGRNLSIDAETLKPLLLFFSSSSGE